MTRILAIVVAVVLAAGGFMWWNSQQGASSSQQAQAERLLGAANAQAAEVDTSGIEDMTLGNPDAPVTVIEYASFTCPHCATFHKGPYKQLKTEYIDTGKINFVYREVYFDRFGLWASAMARCAGTPQAFFGITDMLYAAQAEWARAGGGDPAAIVEEMRKIGRLAGLESDQLDACLQDNDQLRTLVAWYQQNAEEHGISSTPSFVIDGTTYQNMSYEEMARLIEEAAS